MFQICDNPIVKTFNVKITILITLSNFEQPAFELEIQSSLTIILSI